MTDAVLDWLFDLVEWAIAGVPSENIPITLSIGWLTDMNYFIPVSEMFGLFTAMFLLGGPMIGVSLVVWVLVGVLRGGATKL